VPGTVEGAGQPTERAVDCLVSCLLNGLRCRLPLFPSVGSLLHGYSGSEKLPGDAGTVHHEAHDPLATDMVKTHGGKVVQSEHLIGVLKV
jgi:hypothetical protein